MSDQHQQPQQQPPSVKAGLTANRGKHLVGNDEYAGFARRVIAAYSRRIAAGDVEALTTLIALSADLDAAIGEAVKGLRQFGYSWTEIATRLGITRQAAHQRWSGGERHE